MYNIFIVNKSKIEREVKEIKSHTLQKVIRILMLFPFFFLYRFIYKHTLSIKHFP